MKTASWTKVIQPKDFIHVWTCLDFKMPDPDFWLESACFYDDQGHAWKLYLHVAGQTSQYIYLKYQNGGEGGTVWVNPYIHLLDKHGNIFDEYRYKQGDVISSETNSTTSRVEVIFSIGHRLDSLLHNGNLRIQLRLVKKKVNRTGLGTKISDNDGSGWTSDITAFFQNPTFFDIEICSGGETFSAHKLVLAARSTVFRAMLEAPMKEAASSCIKMDEFCPEVVKGMLKYLYSDDVTVVTPALASEFLLIADYYNLDKLKFRAESILGKNLTIENAVEVVKHAIIFRLPRLKSMAIQFILENDVPIADNPGLEGIARTNLKDFLKLLKATRRT